MRAISVRRNMRLTIVITRGWLRRRPQAASEAGRAENEEAAKVLQNCEQYSSIKSASWCGRMSAPPGEGAARGDLPPKRCHVLARTTH
jgi:hypothetical protein